MKKMKKFCLTMSVFMLLGFTALGESTKSEILLDNSNLYASVSGIAAGVADGTYTGSGKGFKGNTVLEVTVKNEKIVAIKVVSYKDQKRWFERAEAKVPNSIIEKQSTDVDTVAGATFSSKGIIKAVTNAIENAKS